MSFPTQKEVEVPMLKVLGQFGGSARPQDVYPKVAEYFPRLTKEDLDERLPLSPGTRKWWNLVQWARQRLVEDGAIDGSTRGVWRLTAKGHQMATGAVVPSGNVEVTAASPSAQTTLNDLVNQNHEAMVKRIIEELNGLTPAGFEHFCLGLLEGLGYESVEVTGKSGDGGIDGYGDYRQGIVKIKSAFQAKRWKGSPVGR